MRISTVEIGEPHQLEHVSGKTIPIVAWHAPHLEPECNVFEDRQMWEEAVALEDHAHIPLVGRHVCDEARTDGNCSMVGLFESGGDSERSGLSTTARSEKRDKLPGCNLEREVFESECRGESLRHVLESQIVHIGVVVGVHQIDPSIS